MRNVVITGASSGIGAATALALDREGVRVFAGVEHDQDGIADLAAASDRLKRVTLDVTSDASVQAAFEQIERGLGGAGLDALVNNAGIGIPGPLELLSRDDLREQLDVNVLGQVAVTQAALPALRRGSGRIVFVSSIGGVLSAQFAGAYFTSKFALEAVGDVFRQELDPEDIPVILVEPSTISTPIWDKAITRLDRLTASDDPRVDRYRERLSGFRERLNSADERGHSPDAAADVIVKALGADSPDTRYVVGFDGKLATALRPLIPDRLFDKIAERVTS